MTVVDESATEMVEVLSPAQARALTDEIRQTLRVGHELIIRAFQGGAWSALGYESWDAYCAGEFSEARMVRLDREQRREIASEMRAAGMSQRAIASGLGVDPMTVNRDLRGVANATPAAAPSSVPRVTVAPVEDRPLTQAECVTIERERVTGSDGKSYPATRTPGPDVPTRRQQIDVSRRVNSALTDIDGARRRLAELTPAHLRSQSDEARSSWAANLAEQLEALHGFLGALNHKEK